MASERQINANRINSRKSSGPSTAEGKKIVSQNAIKHGLLAKKILVPRESRKEFISHSNRLWDSLLPETPIEEILVEMIISYTWRLRRVLRIESELLNPAEANAWSTKSQLEFGFGPNCNQMSILTRYELSLERQLYRAIFQLQMHREKASLQKGSELTITPVEVSKQTQF